MAKTHRRFRRATPTPESIVLKPSNSDWPRPAGCAAPRSTVRRSIASAVVAITAVCLEVLTSELNDPSARAAALKALDANMRQMETLIAASLPDAESFDDAIAVMREVHESRESIQKAAETLG